MMQQVKYIRQLVVFRYQSYLYKDKVLQFLKWLITLLFLYFITLPASAQVTYQEYNQLLKNAVDANGLVNYRWLKTNQERIEKISTSWQHSGDWEKWPLPTQKAFWINVYNLHTILLVCQYYPIRSIRDIADGKPWDLQWIKIEGKTYSLNDIEHNLLRKKFKDPMIHFAINCASISCPALSNRAYEAENLERQLQTRTRIFVRDKNKNRISADRLQLSAIFDWYREDFGSLTDFISRFSDLKIKNAATINFMEYSWDLNERR
ncbi:MAG: DUF547 domain-containing protein [Saprospiraceae bacterium]|nr:DUF547 domain-containing protein [Saprospiraceae bacterium]HMW39392.1 DUF547 domain-containing protein [Saprospiraceae bacterium]HMX89219.1 DUF547 domain-containing protein [Saprospiraceae bacterium]HMZ41155.1 DUF547 domain-containing protein [Saprospiraceae bacterium]HNA64351.1 DUF547 domain-containing protein [Saprospiraceae bacterium]